MNCHSQNTDTRLTFKDYLVGRVGFDVTDEALSVILIDRKVDDGLYADEISKRQKDLCAADLYMWGATLPTIQGGIEDANGMWKHKEGNTTISEADKKRFISLANRIYAQYREKTVSIGSGIRIHNYGIRIFRSR